MGKLIIGSLELRIDFAFDKATEKLTILDHSLNFNDAKITEKVEVKGHLLTDTQIRFGIITFGAKSSIGCNLPLASNVTIQYNGMEYDATTHKTVKGRISSLSALYKNNPSFVPGILIKGSYDLGKNSIKISIDD